MYCKKCGHELNDEAMFCTSCGASVEKPTCNKCHQELKEGSLFCTNCGESVPNQNFGTPQNNQGYVPIQPSSEYSNPKDRASFGYALIGFFFNIVGLILYFVWKDEYPLRAKSCLNGFLVSLVIWVIYFCCFFSIFSSSFSSNYYYDNAIHSTEQ